MTAQIIGYASSVILLLTLGSQIVKQWRSGTSKGISIGFFIGQLATAAGFTTYSLLIGNPIFAATNACLGVAAVAGLGIVFYHRRKARRRSLGRRRAASLAQV